MTTVLSIMLAFAATLWAIPWGAARAAAARASRPPPRGYTSPHVAALESHERWAAIDLARVHPLNRNEIVALLRKVKGRGVGALAPAERAFLDNMVAADDRSRGGAGAAG